MLTKNLTPFLFGAKACSRRPPQPEMTLIVRGAFALRPGAPLAPLEGLDQGALRAETYQDGDDERRGECLYPGDFADFKLNAEVLLRGTCHAPGKRPVIECPVRFRVGPWQKDLYVFGPRAWSDKLPGARMSDPLPFTSMPLDYAHAFGGPGCALNPVGKGWGSDALPNVEHPARLIRARGDSPEPAGFGPLSPAWPQRAGKVGKEYGRAYREKRAPYYAEDFDWSYFSAAPADQQLPGYLRGDEEVSFHNLHPEAPLLSARLPGLRVRAFVKDVDRRLREVPMALDTLFADLDKGTITLTWRGVDPVKEDDLTDVATVLIASEPIAERPLPEAHYKERLEAFERDPVGLKEAFPEGFEEAAKGEGPGGAPAAGADPISGLIQERFGKLAPMEPADQEHLRGAVASVSQRIGPKTDLAAAVAEAGAGGGGPPIALPLRPGALPDLRLRAQMRAVMSSVAEMRKAAAEQKTAVPEQAAQIERIAHDPRWAKLDPGYTPPGPLSTDEPGPGRDLSEQDLSGRDLSGMDLRAARMEGAILAGAKLRDAKLAGANLRGAILHKADLFGADLSGADLTRANAGEARLSCADLRGAALDDAFFEGADLEEAILEDAGGEYVALARARLARAKARRLRLDRSDLSDAVLEQADLAGASLIGSLLARCQGKRADLSGARLGGASFAGADLAEARFVRAHGERSLWERAILDGADFTLAWLIASHFTQASAIGARFFGANLRECRFYRAILERAEIVRANLFAADLCKAKLSGARFNGSSLYDAKLLQASGAGCDFTDANLKRSTLERTS